MDGKRTVCQLFYRQKSFTEGTCAPYQVRLDNGTLIFVPRDENRCVRLLQNELHEAVKRGDVSMVQSLVCSGASMIAVDSMGRTALELAIHHGVAH